MNAQMNVNAPVSIGSSRWQRISLAAAAIVLVLVVGVTSPPQTLTVYPALNHDDYLLLAPAVCLAENKAPTTPPFDSTPTTAALFEGEGSFIPGLSASYNLGLGAWFKAFGVGIWQARLFSYCLGGCLLMAVFWFGAQWWNGWVGLIAAALLALDGSYWLAARTVRPETLTTTAYLVSICLLTLNSAHWRQRTPELAGIALGIGFAGHAIGAVMAPLVFVATILASPTWPGWRYLARFLWPAALVIGAYGAFLFANWESVALNLRLHGEQHEFPILGWREKLAWECTRYMGIYWNAFAIKWGWKLRALVASGWVLLCLQTVLSARREGWTAATRRSLLLALAPMMIAAFMAVLAKDNKNFMYLVYILPWAYLAGVAGIAWGASAIPWPRSWPGLAWLEARAWVAGPAALAILAFAGVHYYGCDAEPYAEGRVIPYDRFEALLAQQLEPGALVLANQASWLAARQAGSEVVFDKATPRWLPSYKRYPIHAAYDTSHIVTYELDCGLLDDITATGKPVYYMVDMWDWTQNAYYPFGRFASSFTGLLRQLDEHTTPVFYAYTRDRGLQTLYRWNPPDGPRSNAAQVCHVEGVPHAIGPKQVPDNFSPNTRLSLTSQSAPVARICLVPGRTYWLHFEVRVAEGSYVIAKFEDRRLLRSFDSRVSVPFDQVVTATGTTADLRLVPGVGSATVEVTNVWVKQLSPGPIDLRPRYDQRLAPPMADRPTLTGNR